MYKTAVVNTNDPIQARFTVGVRAFVKVPISLKPRYVLLKGVKDRQTTRTIEITAGLDTPLELEPAESNLGGMLTYRIEEVEEGRMFKVYFTNLPEASGSFRGYLNLKTNYQEMPVINIRINVRIQSP
ncbi:MAG: hypothetical protein R6V25_01060 [Desulfatiglandales bacterium]